LNRADLETVLSKLDPQAKSEYLDRIQRNPFLVYKPHPMQENFHKSNARVRAFFGGNRSGKTRALIQEVVWWATGLHPYKPNLNVSNPNWIPKDIWVVSLDFPSSRDVVQPMIRKILGSGYLKVWRETDKIIELTNKSTISFKSVDSGWEKFQGTEKHLIAFDEEPSHTVYQECIMRVVTTRGDIIIAMTPLHGMSWIYDEVYEPWLQGISQDNECFVASIKDNPYVSREEIEKIERTFFDEEKEARVSGSFVEFAGLIYKEFDPNLHLVKRFPIPKHWIRVRGIDPGLNNPTGCVWAAISHDNEIFIYDEFYQQGLTIKDLSTAIKAKTGNDVISYTVIDPASASRNPSHPELRSVKDEYARYGIWTMPANNDVSYGINCVKELLHINPKSGRPRLFFFDDLYATRKELVRYRWDTFRHHAEEQNRKERPKKVMDHLMDALRYACASNPQYIPEHDSLEIASLSFKSTKS